MLAVGLLGIILVSVIGLFQSLLSSTAKSSDLSAATVLAQGRLNELVAAQAGYFADYGTDYPTAVLGKGIYVHDSASDTTFYHLVTPQLLQDDPGFGRTYYLEVKVYWNTADPNTVSKNRLGQGQQFLKLGRVVYIPTS